MSIEQLQLETKEKVGTEEEHGTHSPSLPPSLPPSGLTIGLMSIEQLELEIKEKVGTEEEQGQAKRLLPLLHRKHLLLVTLLLFNAASAEALPLFLDDLVPSYIAIIVSVTAVLFFGVSKSQPSLPPSLPPILPPSFPFVVGQRSVGGSYSSLPPPSLPPPLPGRPGSFLHRHYRVRALLWGTLFSFLPSLPPSLPVQCTGDLASCCLTLPSLSPPSSLTPSLPPHSKLHLLLSPQGRSSSGLVLTWLTPPSLPHYFFFPFAC